MSLDETERDISRIHDMVDYGERALRYVAGLEEADFLASELYQDAVIRSVAVVGEAAYRVSAATRGSGTHMICGIGKQSQTNRTQQMGITS